VEGMSALEPIQPALFPKVRWHTLVVLSIFFPQFDQKNNLNAVIIIVNH